MPEAPFAAKVTWKQPIPDSGDERTRFRDNLGTFMGNTQVHQWAEHTGTRKPGTRTWRRDWQRYRRRRRRGW